MSGPTVCGCRCVCWQAKLRRAELQGLLKDQAEIATASGVDSDDARHLAQKIGALEHKLRAYEAERRAERPRMREMAARVAQLQREAAAG